MRRLLLLRHAKTERAERGERDRERKLMKRGRADAATMGHYIVRHHLVPDLALVSPALRTQETWALVAAAFATAPPNVTDDRIYNAGSEPLAELIQETGAAPTLLVVGHNPGLHELALQLIGSGDVGARAALNEKLPTSGLVVVDFALDDWSLLHDHAGRLDRFVSPRSIAAATD
jgi:phosphohistidine phosphatase